MAAAAVRARAFLATARVGLETRLTRKRLCMEEQARVQAAPPTPAEANSEADLEEAAGRTTVAVRSTSASCHGLIYDSTDRSDWLGHRERRRLLRRRVL